MVQSITDAAFEKEVIQSPIPVLVDFWAPWCGPCKVMLPVIENIAEDNAGKVTVVKMNVDENAQIPGQFSVMSIPTFLIFKGGSVVQQFVGARSKVDIQKMLDAVLAA